MIGPREPRARVSPNTSLGAGLFFCRRLRSHIHIDLDLENVTRQALADAQAAGKDQMSQTVLAVQAV